MLHFDKSLTVGQLMAALADMPADLKISDGGTIVTGVELGTNDDGAPLVHLLTDDAFDDWGM